ncbi:TRAP transporter small permease subunit [Rhodobacterales bacterium HKCCE2091]|nr:TRAP transporter small permease subunit [Rhodobacterales bacterium HKCCE2091]
MSHRLADLAAWLAKALMVIAIVATVLMTGHVLADVTARYFFNSPLPGTLEIATHYYLIPMTFLPLAAVELHREHIVVEAFTHFLPDAWNTVLDVVVRLICLAVLILFTWRTGLEAMDSTAHNEEYTAIFFDVPVWPARWVLPLSFAAFALALLSNLLRPPPPADDPFLEEGV